ncbi:MAG: alpha/beta hydrolase [Pseudomonadota bacterium]|nr:alpha/beta hydrolase [Pseudomonadota bacterium]
MWLLLVLSCSHTHPALSPATGAGAAVSGAAASGPAATDPSAALAHCALARTTRVATKDGATIALHHHPASGPPVVLVHGISSNHHFWDLDAEHSFADWLAARGHDVWLLDLRGHGDATVDRRGQPQLSGWRVDDYGRYDVAAAVDHVRGCTGYDQVAYVGHSMGGMVGSIYAATGGAGNLSAMVLVGSPGTFSKTAPMMGLARTGLAAGGLALVSLDSAPLGAVAADLNRGPLKVRIQERLYNPENFVPETIDRMLRSIVSPMSRGEMAHFARMIQDERFQSWDRSIGYLDALRDVKVPAYVVVGMGDRVAAPEWVEAYATAFGGPVELFRAGKVSGLVADYGHLDLGLGERAATEIFPRIDAWLDRYPPARDGRPPAAFVHTVP